MSPAIPPVSKDSLAPEVRDLLAALPPLNLFRVLANASASLRPFLELGASILANAEFDPRLREIAILRVAHTTGASYEWAQHAQLAPGVGVTAREIELVGREGGVADLDEEARLVCRVADEISRDVRLSDETLGELLQRYDLQRATELILCVSYYNMVSRFLESTRVEIEPEDVLQGDTTDQIVARGEASQS